MERETVWLSPRYQSGAFPKPLSIESKMSIYEDRVWGWYLDVGKLLSKEVTADFVVLMIILAFFEGHAMYLIGEDYKSKPSGFLFKYGFKRLLTSVMKIEIEEIEVKEDANADSREKIIDQAADMMWKQARNGLFHEGMTKRGIGLSRNLKDTLRLRGKSVPPDKIEVHLTINVPTLLDAVIYYFQQYTTQLRDPGNAELRDNFNSTWDDRHP